MSALFTAKRGVARTVGSLSRRSRRGGGTTLPGRLLVRMAPDAIERLAAQLDRGSIVVSSTNGKTTTAAMISGILRADRRTPVHNRAGSNMHWGVATALLEQSGDEGLFELDEAWLPRVAPQLRPRLLVLGNLFRTSSTATASWSASQTNGPSWSPAWMDPASSPSTQTIP